MVNIYLKRKFKELSIQDIDLVNAFNVIEYMGYEITNNGASLLQKIYNGEEDNEKNIHELINKFFENFTLTKKILDYVGIKLENVNEVVLMKLYQRYSCDEISFDLFIELLNCFGLEPTVEYDLMDDSDRKNINPTELKEYIVDKGFIYNFDDLKGADSLFGLISHLLGNFDMYSYDYYTIPEFIDREKEIQYENLVVKPLDVISEPIYQNKASKNLNVNASVKTMSFGTKLHFLLETIDFNNPDYSIIDLKYLEFIKSFIESDLLVNVSKGQIYKEYEFYDEENNTLGIIDLMVVYEN